MDGSGEELCVLRSGMIDSRRDRVGGQGRIAATIPHMGPRLGTGTLGAQD